MTTKGVLIDHFTAMESMNAEMTVMNHGPALESSTTIIFSTLVVYMDCYLAM